MIVAKKNLTRSRLGQFGYAFDSNGKRKAIEHGFADNVHKALAELNSLPATKDSPNAYYIVRQGEKVDAGKIIVTFAEARKRPRGRR